MLTILWDRAGTHFNRGRGLRIFVNEELVAAASELTPLKTGLG
jgi:hypothetical protein